MCSMMMMRLVGARMSRRSISGRLPARDPMRICAQPSLLLWGFVSWSMTPICHLGVTVLASQTLGITGIWMSHAHESMKAREREMP